MKTEQGLTPQQEKFARGVASGLSQAEAYRQAYPKSRQWKGEAVIVAGAKLMANGNISIRVAELSQQAANAAALDRSIVLEQIRRIATSDVAKLMHPDGRVKLPHELDPDTAAAIKSFKIDEYGRIEFQFWDKNAALEKAAKILGLFKKDNHQRGGILADLPRELVKGLVERLKTLNDAGQ